jgi:hypothetical protein
MDDNPYRAPQSAPAASEPPDTRYPLLFYLLRALAIAVSGLVVAAPFYFVGATQVATSLAVGIACFAFCTELFRAFARAR